MEISIEGVINAILLADSSIILKDEAQKIVLNTKGFMKDLSEELLEFLGVEGFYGFLKVY